MEDVDKKVFLPNSESILCILVAKVRPIPLWHRGMSYFLYVLVANKVCPVPCVLVANKVCLVPCVLVANKVCPVLCVLVANKACPVPCILVANKVFPIYVS